MSKILCRLLKVILLQEVGFVFSPPIHSKNNNTHAVCTHSDNLGLNQFPCMSIKQIKPEDVF